ncbi:MAG: endonuclease domain-containing protein [Candidatus Ratteibacteria bacterium]
MKRTPAIVGIVPRKNLWKIIQKEKWYHIPVESSPKNVEFVEYIGFYFPKVFGEKLCFRVIYYAKVKKIEVVKRIELFPEEVNHPRANKDYFKFYLEEIKELPRPIPSLRWRRIVHIPTSYEKLLNAEEINDLYDTSALEEKMYLEMKKRNIFAERQFYVKVGRKKYCLDFGIFCKKGNIDVECDGERYHVLPDALTRDRQRNNELVSFGWSVLRFTGKEIRDSIRYCFDIINRTIENLGGISDVIVKYEKHKKIK